MQNRFAAIADEQDAPVVKKAPAPQPKKEAPVKKIKVQVAQPVEDGGDPFESVDRTQRPQRGGERGGRGRGERGGRGRGGDRPQTGGERRERREGEGRGRGERGGRGRGGERRPRPQTAVAEGDSPVVEGEQKERINRGEKGPRFQGKPREEAHPFDRKDGTGRGRRGDKKGGHGKGNWGKEDGREENKNNEERRERRERREKEEQKVEEPVEMEEVGLSIDDFLNAKRANQKGLIQTREARQHEKVDNKLIKESDYDHEMKKES